MFRQNNPDIDFPGLQHAVRRVARHCRHGEVPPLAALPGVQGEAQDAAGPGRGWRARLRAVPVLGGSLAYVRRGVLAASAPGLSWRARLRALPVLGGALGWLHACFTLTRWRRRLQDEVQVLREREQATQRELDNLRRAQGDLLRDLGQLRATLAERDREARGRRRP